MNKFLLARQIQPPTHTGVLGPFKLQTLSSGEPEVYDTVADAQEAAYEIDSLTSVWEIYKLKVAARLEPPVQPPDEAPAEPPAV